MNASFVIASVAGQRVALDALDVEAIIRTGDVTPVPRAPNHVAGLCAVRSTVMTVIDVARAAGLCSSDESDLAAVVLREGHRYALRIDRVSDVESAKALPGANDASIGTGWFSVAPQRIETANGIALLLDLDSVIAGSRRN